MPILERLLPVAASAGLVIFPALPAAGSSAPLRQPISDEPLFPGWLEGEVLVTSQRVFITALSASSSRAELFSQLDLAVLDAVDRAAALDDLDYTGLFDYDDD